MNCVALTFVLVTSSLAVPRYPEEMRFDMGDANSPLANNFVLITPTSVYKVDTGYGFTTPPQTAYNDKCQENPFVRSAKTEYGDPLGYDAIQDGVESDQAITFRANVQRGNYYVTVVLGRCSQQRHDLTITINDKPVATNVDAWGPTCDVPGGPAVRTIKVLTDAPKGRITVTVDCAKPAQDRWKEYTDAPPAGGNLPFLGPNRVSLAAVIIRPIALLPITFKDGKLGTALTDPELLAPIEAFNNGRLDQAIDLTLKIDKGPLTLPRACLLEFFVGRFEITDPQREMRLLSESIANLTSCLRFAPGSATIAERLEQNRRYSRALFLLYPSADKSATQPVGLSSAQRYWGAFDLCESFTEDDPLFLKARLLCARVANWSAKEGGWKHAKALADRHLDILKKALPDKNLNLDIQASPTSQPAPAATQPTTQSK